MKFRKKYKKRGYFHFNTYDYTTRQFHNVKLQVKCIFWFTIKKYTLDIEID